MRRYSSTRPFRTGAHTVPPSSSSSTAHLSYEETTCSLHRESLEYNPDVKVCVLAGLRNETASSLAQRGDGDRQPPGCAG